MVEVFTLGEFVILNGGRAEQGSLSRSARDLAAYLLMHPRQHLRRERLVEMFWGEMEESRARKAMSHALWQIRRITGLDRKESKGQLTSDGGHVMMQPGPSIFVDARAFCKRLGAALSNPADPDIEARLDAALKLYRGSFLEHSDDPWVVELREELQSQYVKGMRLKIALLAQSRRYDDAIDCARRVLGVDPLRESMQRQVMRLEVLNGNRAHALRQYDRCARMLRSEYGVDPMPDTQNLYQRIRSGTIFSALEEERKLVID
jgi:DNA-binding SARP family transcriptional activator